MFKALAPAAAAAALEVLARNNEKVTVVCNKKGNSCGGRVEIEKRATDERERRRLGRIPWGYRV